MKLVTESYQAQAARWPSAGRHILAHFDAESIVVYQAYRSSIGRFAAEHGTFGDGFSLSRMSWIKPNFLWMMYRSGWGTKPDQEVVLAIRLRRAAFENILAQAVASRFEPAAHASPAEYRQTLAQTAVRLQWDPDHDPAGMPVERRAIQLGLRGEALRQYAREWIVDIEDISAFVAEQRPHAAERPWTRLQVPRENVYPISDAALARRLGMQADEPSGAVSN
jgi:hypothetical protein